MLADITCFPDSFQQLNTHTYTQRSRVILQRGGSVSTTNTLRKVTLNNSAVLPPWPGLVSSAILPIDWGPRPRKEAQESMEAKEPGARRRFTKNQNSHTCRPLASYSVRSINKLDQKHMQVFVNIYTHIFI